MSDPQLPGQSSMSRMSVEEVNPTAGRQTLDSAASSSIADDDQEDYSAPESDPNDNISQALTSFRKQWHDEIANVKNIELLGCEEKNSGIEAQASRLYTQGVKNEQDGRLYEAIQCYRKAVQLVPDIEFKMYESVRAAVTAEADDIPIMQVRRNHRDSTSSDDNEDGPIDLSMKLHSWMSRALAPCVPAREQSGTHISSLPMEVLLLIFRWVVSRDLDIRSLEMCSMVCRGFYVGARDSEIWRLICKRIWKINCESLSNYLTWRDMFMKRPHLNFSGCYISKTTYIRHGENNFQDQFYRPWHVVEYFRYLRFFPDGRVLMMTTADSPGPTVVAHLRHRNAKYPAVIVGSFKAVGDRIIIAMKRDFRDRNVGNNRQKPQPQEHQSYYIKLAIKPWKTRVDWLLVWESYIVYGKRGATESVTNFDVHINTNKFPPFCFSRVKSFTNESESSLS